MTFWYVGLCSNHWEIPARAYKAFEKTCEVPGRIQKHVLEGHIFFCTFMAVRQDGLLQGSEWEKVGLGSDNLGSLPDLLISNSFVGTFTTPSRYFFNDWILVISLAVK